MNIEELVKKAREDFQKLADDTLWRPDAETSNMAIGNIMDFWEEKMREAYWIEKIEEA